MGLFQKLFSGRQLPFIILTAAVITWLLCLPLFQDGMFIDGIQYAAVARNLALGVGSFWNPVLAQNSVAGLNSFHEHPPLALFIQSLFFKIFGANNIYPERIYCLFTFLLTGLFVSLIWRKIFEGRATSALWWLPVLLWIIMPVVFWGYTNDIQENTMGVFTTAAVYFFLVAAGHGSALRSASFYWGCCCVLLAVLSKGIPGLFPITFFFIYWFAPRIPSNYRGGRTASEVHSEICPIPKTNFTTVIVYSFTAGLLLAMSAFIILQNPVAKESLHTWFFDRMLKRMSSDPVEQSHFHILIGLFTEQLPALILVAVGLIIFRVKQVKNDVERGYVVVFLLLGSAASLPLMLTLVQRDFYFTPALPMFAIAWALLIADGLNRVTDTLMQLPKWKNAITAFAIVALLSGVLVTVMQAGKMKRDKEMLQDVYTIKRLVPENSFVSVTSDIMWMNWSFRCYMVRYNSISFSDKDTCNYFIALNGDKVGDKYIPVKAPLHMFKIYKAK